MSEQEYYFTVDKLASAEFRDKGSKFIAYVFPLSVAADFKKKMDEIKKEHPKATHYCFAYRIGLDGNSYRVSDDGEPSGTAGKPILGQIDSKQLSDLGIVVVRYFGGTLLGVPGLINAYKSAASMALQVSILVQKQIERDYRVQFDYTMMNPVMTVVKQFNLTVKQQEMQLFCSITVGIPVNRVQEVLYRFKDIRNVEVVKVDN
jgi:uncharacterized YigZ family protein